MTSPARKHFIKATAAASSAAGQPLRSRENATAYDLQLMQLAEDKRTLSGIQSIATKAEKKAELIPNYLPWVEGVLQGDQGVQDDVLMTILVWCIDAAMYEEALQLAGYAIKHDLAMPDNYNRTTAVVIAEEIADAWLKAYATDEPIGLHIIQCAIDITQGKDMPDQVQAKLYKALGYAFRDESLAPSQFTTLKERLIGVIAVLKKAVSLNGKAGVKKDIENAERDLKNLPE